MNVSSVVILYLHTGVVASHSVVNFFVLLVDDPFHFFLPLLTNPMALQLGYTKKQEERHFRGVITLEVNISGAFSWLLYIYHVSVLR